VSLLALSIAKNLTQHDIQFGMGSRSCVGMNIALVETHKFISQFVRYFDIELVDKENHWKTRSQLVLISIELLGEVKGQRGEVNPAMGIV
jgi:hypothetical protein